MALNLRRKDRINFVSLYRLMCKNVHFLMILGLFSAHLSIRLWKNAKIGLPLQRYNCNTYLQLLT